MKPKQKFSRLCFCIALIFAFTFYLNAQAQEVTYYSRPNDPSGLTATVNGSSVTLTWTDNSTNETGFKMYRGPLWTDIGNVDPNVTTFVDSSRSPGTYTYKVQAFSGAPGNILYSAPSPEITVTVGTATGGGTGDGGGSTTTGTGSSGGGSGTTGTGSGSYSTPSSPSGLTAAVNSNLVTLTWTDNSTNETGFKVYRGPVWTDIGNVGANVTTFVDSRQPGAYVYRVQAFNQINGGYPLYSGLSNDFTVTVGGATSPTNENSTTGDQQNTTRATDPTSTVTAPAPTGTPTGTAPLPPSDLTATVSGNSVRLNWKDNSAEETGFKLYRGPLWTDIGNVGPNVTSYTVSDLTPGPYSFRLQSFSGAAGSYFKYSAVSNSANVTIEAKATEVQPVSANIRVSAVNSANEPLPNVFVTVEGGAAVIAGHKTDSLGTATFTLPSGVYTVQANIGSDSGYINPAAQTLDIANADSKELKFMFEQRSGSLLRLKGIARLDSGAATDAFVWAWSESGDSLSVKAGSDGSYSFMVKPQTGWHVGAAKETAAGSYKAAETAVTVGTADASFDPVLVRVASAIAPAVQTASAGSAVNAKTDDGAFVAVPAGQPAAGGGSITLEIKPTLEAPAQATKVPISTVYDVTVTDNGTGQKITTFGASVEIRIPYNETGVVNLGIDEKALKPSYYDEQADTWVPISDYTVDTENNSVVAWVNHLTRFAIVMPADTTPPLAPASLKASALNTGAVYLTWKNPVKDFKYTKIFRADRAQDKGALIANSLTSEAYVDSGVVLGKTYYYLVKAVDPAGNESVNKETMSAKSYMGSQEAPATASAGKLTRDLKLGQKGSDVTVLQSFLKSQRMFAAKPTGYFGTITKSAVQKFQNSYPAETYKADKLRTADGWVRSATRSKLNQLIGQ
ncbi:MAG: fibronectin type III domain-containing protein [Candidatus Saccharibacteria bacterium]